MFTDATPEEINTAANRSWLAFQQYRQTSLKQRALLLRHIASQLLQEKEVLLNTAAAETHLSVERLNTELTRTCFQLTAYAEACKSGSWLQLRIDTALPAQQPPVPDLRKTMVPLGPVAVFGASNFPFAYSTAGGDTACALAAGCTVIVKAHPAHPHTSEAVAAIVKTSLQNCSLPNDVFIHLHGAAFESGKALVLHPLVKAVGFTGSLQGGRALFDIAASRPEPIPVFAEMGSTNPVFVLPQKLSQNPQQLAHLLAQSITQSVGQFCTNPGIIVVMECPGIEDFIKSLAAQIAATAPQKMLHPGIAKSFSEKRTAALQTGVVALIAANETAAAGESIPTLTQTKASQFLQNPLLHEEVFGPYSLMVRCNSEAEMLQVAHSFSGQLTATIMATEEEAATQQALILQLQQLCGRLIFNGVPTGVTVALAMHHGGPYPATTDSRFTAVGADGIGRFARPVCYQNWPNALLPDELKNENPLELWRTVNNNLTKGAVASVYT